MPIFDPDSLKIRPIDTEFNARPEVQHYNLEGQYYIQAERVFDGDLVQSWVTKTGASDLF